MHGTGFLPTDEVNIYHVERDDLYLTGLEVALAGLHMGEILEESELPLQYAGVLDVLPARGRRGRQGHARDVPRAPVRQGRDVVFCLPDASGDDERCCSQRGGARRSSESPTAS